MPKKPKKYHRSERATKKGWTTKKQFAYAMVELSPEELTHEEAEARIDLFLETMEELLMQGEKITFPGYFRVYPVLYDERRVKRPLHNSESEIDLGMFVGFRFRVSRELREKAILLDPEVYAPVCYNERRLERRKAKKLKEMSEKGEKE